MTAPLDNLHDFYQPPPPAWTPQTIGWYAVFAIIALLVAWAIVHVVRSWLANRYRREALRELATLEPAQFSALLKRTALAAWPREQVAALNGEPWLRFLDEAAPSPLFTSAPASRVEDLALKPTTLSSEDERSTRETVARWIKRHRRQHKDRRQHVQA